MSLKGLSVFLPAYNEEKNLEKTVNNVRQNITSVADKWEIIIVDDGSKDSTGKIADHLAKSDWQIRVIHHNPNHG